MKLNGWKRMGVITSVLWILCAGFYTYTKQLDEAARVASNASVTCEELRIQSGQTDLSECDARGKELLDSGISGARITAAVVALVPVPLGWGFVYLSIFLIHWIKRGFAPIPSS